MSTPQRNPELRRELIIEAATTAIAARGVDAMTIPRLGRQVGIPVATIYSLFLSKHELLQEICERHLDALLEAVEQADLPAVRNRRRLDALALALLKAIDGGSAANQVLAIGLARLPVELQHDLRQKQSWLSALFADALEAAVPRLTARRKLAGAATTSMIVLLQTRDQATRKLGREAYARFAVSSILGGLGRELRNGSRRNPRQNGSGNRGL